MATQLTCKAARHSARMGVVEWSLKTESNHCKLHLSCGVVWQFSSPSVWNKQCFFGNAIFKEGSLPNSQQVKSSFTARRLPWIFLKMMDSHHWKICLRI